MQMEHSPQTDEADELQPIADGEIPPRLQSRLLYTPELEEDDDDFWEEEPQYINIDNEVEVARTSLLMAMLPYHKLRGIRLVDINREAHTRLVMFSRLSGLTLVALGIAAYYSSNLIFALIACLVLVFMMLHKIVILENDEGEELIVQVKIGKWAYFRANTFYTQRMIFQNLEDYEITIPPSVACLVQTPSFHKAVFPKDLLNINIEYDDYMTAAGILRGMILSFWALGHIHLRYQVNRHHLFGIPIRRHQQIAVQMGRLPHQNLIGHTELTLFEAIGKWENEHSFMGGKILWQPAPTLNNVLDHFQHDKYPLITSSLLRRTRRTILERNFARSKDNETYDVLMLRFDEDIRYPLLNDAAKIQSIAEDTRTYYYPVAVEIERSIAYIYTYWRK